MSEDAAPVNTNIAFELFRQSYMQSPGGAHAYFKEVNPHAEGAIRFDKHFNPALAEDSHYFHTLHAFLGCVERHASQGLSEAQQEKVCAKEYKALRLQALDTKLMYHNVNRRHFANELALFNNESAF